MFSLSNLEVRGAIGRTDRSASSKSRDSPELQVMPCSLTFGRTTGQAGPGRGRESLRARELVAETDSAILTLFSGLEKPAFKGEHP